MHRSTGLFLTALAAAVLTQGASAADHNSAVIIGKSFVYYGDLNLATRQGAAALHQRISVAAAEACGGAPNYATNYRDAPGFFKAEFERCRTLAIRTAIADVRRTQVVDAY